MVEEDDNKLRTNYENGKSIEELALDFKRLKLAIKYRLFRLGLLPDFIPPNKK